ncbi:hypothetical protein G7046_g7915 [Stylonectria norvegica]|nr:hypothetical protein G7046_g7915 [Stylonectria norvegica]
MGVLPGRPTVLRGIPRARMVDAADVRCRIDAQMQDVGGTTNKVAFSACCLLWAMCVAIAVGSSIDLMSVASAFTVLSYCIVRSTCIHIHAFDSPTLDACPQLAVNGGQKVVGSQWREARGLRLDRRQYAGNHPDTRPYGIPVNIKRASTGHGLNWCTFRVVSRPMSC